MKKGTPVSYFPFRDDDGILSGPPINGTTSTHTFTVSSTDEVTKVDTIPGFVEVSHLIVRNP